MTTDSDATTMTTDVRPRPGDRVEFDSRRTSWLARACTKDGRYLLLTSAMFGTVNYTIVDFEVGRRGPMNVIGHGLGIDTISGPDPNIDEAIELLEVDEGWEISYRNNVPLRITALREGTDE